MPGGQQRCTRLNWVSVNRIPCMNYCSNRSPALEWQLRKTEWAVMGYLTWKSAEAAANSSYGDQRRGHDFLKIIGLTCGVCRLRTRNLAIYAKSEFGEGGRGHFNFLIGAQGLRSVPPEIFSENFHRLWEKFYGLAKVTPFDPLQAQQGIAYIAKQEYGQDSHALNHWEYFSPAFKRLLHQSAEEKAGTERLSEPVAMAERFGLAGLFRRQGFSPDLQY